MLLKQKLYQLEGKKLILLYSGDLLRLDTTLTEALN